MTRSTLVSSLLLIAVAATASAQEKKAAGAPPPAPTMSAEGRKFIDGWLGNWTSNDTVFTMGAQKMPGTFTMACERVSSGWGTLCRMTMTFKDMPASQGTLLMAWDLGAGQAHMFEVADSGEVHDHAGQWIDAKSVSLVHQGKTWEGKLEKDACTATWATAREIKFDCTGTQAGTTVWTLTSTARR